MGTKSEGRNYGWVFIALLALLVAAPSAFGQALPGSSTGGDLAAYQKVLDNQQQMSATLSQIASNREAVVAQTADAWVQTAQERGYGPGWREELEAALNSLCDDKLAKAALASSYDDVVRIISGRPSRSSASKGGGASTSSVDTVGSDTSDLVAFFVNPCRIVDTRVAGGPIPSGGSRSFVSNGSLTSQGGNAAGCGIPGNDPSAIIVTITAVNEVGNGNLFAYAFGSPVPLASALNYKAGVDIANTTVVPECILCGPDFTITTNGANSQTDVVIDIVGYFWSTDATALDVQNIVSAAVTCNNGSSCTATAVCPAGYSLVGGGFGNSAFSTNNDFVWNAPDNFGTSTTTWLTQSENTSGSNLSIRAIAMCARIPGR